ncbi:unnamed protein product [Rotaria magnacalcarata]|uniref:Uncharacterized protein n=3 Tax=Rotaria magnacalcarata TaxID=392030 RepID=A0A816QDD2_9BILA|nr:unnamed protein product [Rotaria magnacalcarata]
MHDIVNNFRNNILGLPALHTRQTTFIMVNEHVPFTYCWSPSLVPKPIDWPPYINVSGVLFLNHDATADKKRPVDLIKLLGIDDDHRNELLSSIIYIGFGSITGNDSDRLLHVVLEALKKTGYRALLYDLAEFVDKLPGKHFQISGICHHGGVGTTATGLRVGKPIIIVRFVFGNQFFWVNVIVKNGIGPRALPGKTITADNLAEAFTYVHQSNVKAAAERIRDPISKENGCDEALHAFNTCLPLSRTQSDLDSTYAALRVVSGRIEPKEVYLHAIHYWPSIFDNRIHLPLYDFVKYTQKAIIGVFSGSTTGIKEGLIKGVGHLYIGLLSLYGELTDLLDAASFYYDPHSESSIRSRPYVTDFQTSCEAAIFSLIYGWKDDSTDLVSMPPIVYERDGTLGRIAGFY